MATPAAVKANASNINALKDAGKSSIVIGVAATVTLFAVQAALIAGKVVVADVKNVAKSLKS